MMSVIQVFRRLFQFSVAFNIFKVMAFTKSQRLFMLNTYLECKNYAAIARRFHAEFNIHIDRTTISRTIKKFREDGNLTTRCATQRSKLSTDVTNQIVRFFIRNPRKWKCWGCIPSWIGFSFRVSKEGFPLSFS